MIKGGKGGSSTKTGLFFEKRVDIRSLLETLPGYYLNENEVFYNGELVALLVGKHDLYKKFLKPSGVNWKEYISRKLLPDEAVYVYESNEMHIIEMKFQKINGSVDEKLQTCAFKKQQYSKLLSPLGIKVHYTYLLNDYFKTKKKYSDVFEYINSSGCNYFFSEIPLDFLGLPFKEEQV
jgi:hypothetical protein